MIQISHIGKQYGRYTIKRAIGEGRYGSCFLAYSDCGDQVVIKRLKSGHIKKKREKSVMEAATLSQIEHKSVPKLLGIINEKILMHLSWRKKPALPYIPCFLKKSIFLPNKKSVKYFLNY